jgi:translation initiation factor RLI1
MESKESMNSCKFKVGDLVSFRMGQPSLFGMVVKTHRTKAGTNEYSVSWLQEQGRSRCTEGILEMVSKK